MKLKPVFKVGSTHARVNYRIDTAISRLIVALTRNTPDTVDMKIDAIRNAISELEAAIRALEEKNDR